MAIQSVSAAGVIAPIEEAILSLSIATFIPAAKNKIANAKRVAAGALMREIVGGRDILHQMVVGH